MTRLILPLLLSVCAGCVDVAVAHRDLATHPSTPAALAAPVTADQVTADNARRMAQALWDECDREESTQLKQ